MALWLPQTALTDARHTYEARVRGMVDHDAMAHWNRRLKEIDQDLELVKARETASAQGLRPGYWHVIRWNNEAAPMIHVHEGPDGAYREPDSGLFEDLKRKDMWSDRSMAERRKRQQAVEREVERQHNEERRRRNEEAVERFKALESPGVSMHGSFAKQKKV